MLWLLLIVFNFPIYHILVRYVFWDDWGGFWKALKFFFTPELFSALRGEFYEDLWEELKLTLFLGACAGLILAEYQLLQPLWKN